MSKRVKVKEIAYIGIILVLVVAILYSGLRILESTVFYEVPGSVAEAPSKTITRDGVAYFPRQDITVLLVMGIDEYGPVQDSGSYNNSGAADMVALLIFDEKDESCTVLSLNRDTMLDIPVLGIGDKPAGTVVGQLALSHTYGSGLEDSCENTRNTVSQFLYGITVDHYIAMNMDAISIINDSVGGVTVTVEDDFSAVDPSIQMGEMTLRGEQAINFVRTRKDVGDQLNISRMERQKQYMEGFVNALRETMEQDENFVLRSYDEVSEYIITDCSVNVISGMLQRYTDYTLKQVVSPEGENVLGEKYYEFYVEEEALDALILELFYAPK